MDRTRLANVEVAKERHKIMLEVMAGERLIPDE